jgi:hypothetical protein
MSTRLHFPCRVCLRKLAVLPGRPPGRVPVGACYVGEAPAPPRPGDQFCLMRPDTGHCLITSVVQRLLDARTFLTYNSVYQLEVVVAATLRAARRRRTRRRVAVRIGPLRKRVVARLQFRELNARFGS